jgi:hypothetical protein
VLALAHQCVLVTPVRRAIPDAVCHRPAFVQEIQEAEIAEQRRMAAALRAEFQAKQPAPGGAPPTEEEMFWDYGQSSAPQPPPTQPQRTQVTLPPLCRCPVASGWVCGALPPKARACGHALMASL